MKINMPPNNLIGFHASIRGGIDRSVDRLKELNCSTGQIFTKSNRQWKARELKGDEVENFIQKSRQLEGPVVAHTSYLINPANHQPEGRKKSIRSLITELKRAGRLEIPYLILHPGLHKGEGEKKGLQLIVDCLDEVFSAIPKVKTTLLLENTAGQGTALGYKLEQLRTIRKNIKSPDRVGYCLDTCHLWAGGYSLAPREKYEKLMDKVDNILGTVNVKTIHLNDALEDRNSQIDRHEHIGKGKIGPAGFRLLINDEQWKNTAKILETPVKNNNWKKYYGQNLKTLVDYIN